MTEVNLLYATLIGMNLGLVIFVIYLYLRMILSEFKYPKFKKGDKVKINIQTKEMKFGGIEKGSYGFIEGFNKKPFGITYYLAPIDNTNNNILIFDIPEKDMELVE